MIHRDTYYFQSSSNHFRDLYYDEMNHVLEVSIFIQGIKPLAGKLRSRCLHHKNLKIDEINPTVFDLSQWKRM